MGTGPARPQPGNAEGVQQIREHRRGVSVCLSGVARLSKTGRQFMVSFRRDG